MSKSNILTFLFLFFSLAGCSEDTGLSTEELAEYQGVYWWVLQLPDNLKQDDTVGIRFKYPNGKMTKHGGSSNLTPGSKLKIFISDIDEEDISFAIVRSLEIDKNHTRIQTGGRISGKLKNKSFDFDGMKSWKPVGSIVNLGDLLIKKSKEHTINDVGQPLIEKEIGITVAITGKN